jgi:hypothetical protein
MDEAVTKNHGTLVKWLRGKNPSTYCRIAIINIFGEC